MLKESFQVISIIFMLLMTTTCTTYAYDHQNYTQSKGCSSMNMTRYWYNDVCKHQPPPRAVATTTFHCYNNGTCESDGWIPVHE